MKIKKIAIFLLIILIVISIILGGEVFPKYAMRFIFFGVLLLIDLACWRIFKKYNAKKKFWYRGMLDTAYWLPVVAFVTFLLTTYFFPLQDWIPVLRIYVPGVLVVLFIWKFILLISFLIGELIAMPINFYRNRKAEINDEEYPETWRSQFFITAGLVAATSFSLLLFSGFYFWVYDFQVKRLTIEVEDLPPGLDGIKIVQLSDIHLGSWISKHALERAVDSVNSLHPDLIVFTGDLVNFVTSEAFPFQETMEKLKAPLGEYAVLGNHDYGDYVQFDSYEDHKKNNLDLEEFYRQIGWKLLKNSNVLIHRGDDSLALLGVENWSSKKIWGQRGDLQKALTGVSSVQTKILLSHDPTHWDKEVIRKYPDILLTLSGHTHAMQMGWEIGRFRWSPAKWAFDRWAGLYTLDNQGKDQYLNVNRGLGNLGIPARVGIRPEITLIVLKKARASAN